MMYLGDKAVGINSLRGPVPSFLLSLTYGQGLNRTYDSYSLVTNRARSTGDIQLNADECLEIIINDNNYQVAVGAWDADDYKNILYSDWNKNLQYVPFKNVLIKIVLRNQADTALIENEIPENAVTIKISKIIKTYELYI